MRDDVDNERCSNISDDNYSLRYCADVNDIDFYNKLVDERRHSDYANARNHHTDVVVGASNAPSDAAEVVVVVVVWCRRVDGCSARAAARRPRTRRHHDEAARTHLFPCFRRWFRIECDWRIVQRLFVALLTSSQSSEILRQVNLTPVLSFGGHGQFSLILSLSV